MICPCPCHEHARCTLLLYIALSSLQVCMVSHASTCHVSCHCSPDLSRNCCLLHSHSPMSRDSTNSPTTAQAACIYQLLHHSRMRANERMAQLHHHYHHQNSHHTPCSPLVFFCFPGPFLFILICIHAMTQPVQRAQPVHVHTSRIIMKKTLSLTMAYLHTLASHFLFHAADCLIACAHA